MSTEFWIQFPIPGGIDLLHDRQNHKQDFLFISLETFFFFTLWFTLESFCRRHKMAKPKLLLHIIAHKIYLNN